MILVMAHTNVSSCVLSIVASFDSGLDVLKKLKETRKQRKRSRPGARAREDELRLTESLRRGPEDVEREYEKVIQIAGDHFAIGDAIAQTSLAEVLFGLNTGLVNIIASFLHRDKKDVELDYYSLTDLSERSRIDTCRTLRHLLRRITHSRSSPAADSRVSLPYHRSHTTDASDSRLSLPYHRSHNTDASDSRLSLPYHRSHTTDDSVTTTSKQRRSSKPHSKMHGPTLARVTVQNSSKPSQVALVKPGERRKKSSSSNISKPYSYAPSAASTPSLSPPPPYQFLPDDYERPAPIRQQTAPETRGKPSAMNIRPPPPPDGKMRLPETRRKPLAMSVRPPPPLPEPTYPPIPRRRTSTMSLRAPRAPYETMQGSQSTSRLHLALQDDIAPLPTIELRRRRKETPTYYSIASDSTKLGEIPLHKWAEPWDFDAMERLNHGVEAAPPQTVEKKRKGFFRFFRRREAGAA